MRDERSGSLIRCGEAAGMGNRQGGHPQGQERDHAQPEEHAEVRHDVAEHQRDEHEHHQADTEIGAIAAERAALANQEPAHGDRGRIQEQRVEIGDQQQAPAAGDLGDVGGLQERHGHEHRRDAERRRL